MSNTVVFLGAGASVPLGLPITGGLLPELLRRLEHTPGHPALFEDDEEDQAVLHACLLAILPGLPHLLTDEARAAEDWHRKLPLITDVLSAVDYLLLSGRAPGRDFGLDRLARARVLLERAMFELLVRKPPALEGMPDIVQMEWGRASELHFFRGRAPDEEAHLGDIVNWLFELVPDPARDRVTLVSTNYDIEVEQELYTRLGYHRVFEQVDFGVEVREPAGGTVFPRPAAAPFGVYKLHGSLNWLRCELCGNVYVNPAGSIAYLSFLLGRGAARYANHYGWLPEIEKAGGDQCHCGFRPLRHVIVAPSFVRDVRDPLLLEVWSSALEALRQADEWIIAGYSLPPEDVAIRAMLLRAYQGRDQGRAAPKVTVVQWEEREPELTRYNLLFPGHTYVPGGLPAYLAARGGVTCA